MHRTTVALRDELHRRLTRLAEETNRSTPNLIETILLQYLEDNSFVDEFEMNDIRSDKGLKRSIARGMADYKAKRGQIV